MSTTRREFLKRSITAGVGMFIAPTIVPASVFGPNAPSNRINIGAIGTGRISRDHDMPGVWKYDDVRIIAAADVDVNRVVDAKKLVEGYYSKKLGKPYTGVTTYGDYRELLANKDIDAAKLKLTTEIAAIGEIKTETETTRFYVDYDDLMLSLLKEAAKKMINTCNEYQKRHGKKTLFEVPEV